VKRLDPDTTDLEDLFGVEFAPKRTSGGRMEDKGIKVKFKDAKDAATKAEHKVERAGKGWLRSLGRTWHGLTPTTRTAAAYGAGGIVVGGIVVIVAGHLGRSSTASEQAPAPKAAPPPPPPGKQTAHAGATLTVTTRKPGQHGTLRATASTAGAVVAYLPPGTVVTVESAANGGDGKRWYQVQTKDGTVGWMHGDILA
jgi:hypothetical protein